MMEVMPMTQARPDCGRRPRNGAEGDEETQDKYGEAAAGDLYGMLGYCESRTAAITTQQWLAFRLIEL